MTDPFSRPTDAPATAKTGLDALLARSPAALSEPFLLATNTDAASRLLQQGHLPVQTLAPGVLPAPADSTRLVVDVTDGGLRSHPACGWLLRLLQHASEVDAEVWLLDRPNPMDGCTVEGPVARLSHTGPCTPLGPPLRHGLTPAELARFWAREQALSLRLQVFRCEGWDRREPAAWTSALEALMPGLSVLSAAGVEHESGEPPVVTLPGGQVDRLVEYCSKGALDAQLEGVTFAAAAVQHTGSASIEVQMVHPMGVDSLLLALVLLEARLRSADDPYPWPHSPDGFALDRLLGTPDARVGLECRVRASELHAIWREESLAFTSLRNHALLY